MQTQELLDRYEYTVKYQMQEIDRLRAELERRDQELTQLLAWINGDSDALVTLQRIYMDPLNARSHQSSRPSRSLRTIQALHAAPGLAQARALKNITPKTIDQRARSSR